MVSSATYTINGMKFNVNRFDSAQQYASYLSDKPLSDTAKEMDWDVRNNIPYSPNFYGVRSIEEAYNLLENGYEHKTLPELVKFSKEVKKKLAISKKKTFPSVVGFAPIVPHAILGLPNSMLNSAKLPIKSRVVKIFYNPVIFNSTKPQEVEQGAKTLIELIYSLESEGYRVELNVITESWPGRGEAPVVTIGCIPLKSAGNHLDLKRLMFPLFHVSWARVLGFRFQETHPNETPKDSRGYSIKKHCPCNKVNDISDELFAETLFGKDSYYISRLDTERGVKALIEEMTK